MMTLPWSAEECWRSLYSCCFIINYSNQISMYWGTLLNLLSSPFVMHNVFEEKNLDNFIVPLFVGSTITA